MTGFEKDRKWTIEKKNESAIKSMEIGEKAEEFVKKRSEVEEGISRIPTDLPEELQQQVNEAIDNARSSLEREKDELADEAKEAQDNADETIDNIRNIADDYQQKAEKLRGVGGIPLIGSFAETKAGELDNQVEQMTDLAKETQQYSDKLAESRTKLLSK